MTIDDWNPGTGLTEGTFAEERDPELTELERQAQAETETDDEQDEPSSP